MFFSKTKIREQDQALKGPLEEKKSSMNSFLKEIVTFTETMKKLLKDTVEKHHTVNDQHNDLANLTEDVKQHMNTISDLNLKTNEATEALYSEGNKLIEITEDTVKMSQEGKIAIEEMTEIIKVLENENINSKKMIDELAAKFVANQKAHISTMSKDIKDIDDLLKITVQAIETHIEEADTVDKHLEKTSDYLDMYSKKVIEDRN